MPDTLDTIKAKALLAEYDSLRTESLEAIGHRYQIVSVAFAAVSVIIAGLLTTQVAAWLAGAIALVFVPQIAKAALVMWLGEYDRSIRAGRYIATLEKRINKLAGEENLIGWERSLVRRDTHMTYPYVALVVLLDGVGFVAAMVGTYLLATVVYSHRAFFPSPFLVVVAVLFIALLLEIIFICFFRRKWAEIRRPPPSAANNAPQVANVEKEQIGRG